MILNILGIAHAVNHEEKQEFVFTLLQKSLKQFDTTFEVTVDGLKYSINSTEEVGILFGITPTY
jgi:hypothetical protein